MTIEVRPVGGDDELEALKRSVSAAFGIAWSPPSPERQAVGERLRDRSRELVAVEDGRVIGGCFSYDLQLTVPGGATVPVAGLAGVGVDPTRTGRGVLRALMAAQLADARQRGEVASALLASESGIYGRFGYGMATSMSVYEAASPASQLRHPLDDDGSLELVTDTATARSMVADLYRQVAQRVAGTTSRSDAWWDAVFGGESSWLGGGAQLCVVHRERSGRPDGYVLYTVESGPSDGQWIAGGTVKVRELVGLDLTAELALWEYCTRIPLTRKVRLELAPVDPRLRWHLADPRQLRTVASHDLLWLRPLDLAGLLEARTYDADGRVAFEVEAPADDDTAGTWTLEVAGGRGVVRRGGSPTVRLGLPALATLCLGEVTAVGLAAAGMVSGESDDVRLLSRMLATDIRPFCFSKF